MNQIIVMLNHIPLFVMEPNTTPEEATEKCKALSREYGGASRLQFKWFSLPVLKQTGELK